jgi:integrase/recombinase XerD
MKRLTLINTSFEAVEKSFKKWLDTLGYSSKTIYGLPIHVREFLHYLENNYADLKLKQLANTHVNAYYMHLQTRTNIRHKSGALGSNSLNKHQQAIKLFFQYLRQSGRIILPAVELRNEASDTKEIEVLTELEIKELFDAPFQMSYKLGEEHIQQRDRAILVIFYGCGLRRNEAYHLNISDFCFDNKTLKVRKAKNYKQRLVPVHSSYMEILQEYIFDSRIKLTESKTEQAFFLSVRHTRMNDQSLAMRLKKMLEITGIEKRITLHTLRHSVATHLLQKGMKLEQIARFLGHSSLESTQIYTHIIQENESLNTEITD